MKRATRSGLFLLEMIIMLLFFAVTCAVSVRLFATTSRMSRESTDLTAAVTKTESAAEAFQSADGSLAAVGKMLGGSETGGSLVIYYDKALLPVSEQEAEYSLTIRPKNGGEHLASAAISFARGQDTIYTLDTSVYVGGGAAK